MQKHLDQGRQGYLICPLIEEDDSGLQSVTQYGELVKEAFPTATVGVLHGKMKPAEKEQVMEAFSRGRCSCWCPPPWWRWAWTCPTP